MHILLSIQAYLDPGSGSFIIQLLIGAFVGIAVAVRAYWGRIRAFFNKDSAANDDINTLDTPEDMPDNE